MVAVNTDSPEDDEVAIGLLRAGGARMIERAQGTWRNGKWVDFDPVSTPNIVETREQAVDALDNDRATEARPHAGANRRDASNDDAVDAARTRREGQR
jgi:hypothetical protein